MANELITHYEQYKQIHGDTGYCMEKAKYTDRVKFIQEYIETNVIAGSRILDIGCGDLYLAKLMPQFEWVGIDIAPDMSNGKAIKHDLMTAPYPFPDVHFDAIVCSEVLEHLWDLRVVHKEAHRLLKKQGLYVISTPNYDNIDYKLNNYKQLLFDDKWTHLFEHIRQYNFDVHQKFLVQAGFQVVDYTGCDAHYVQFFEEARKVLMLALNRVYKLHADITTVDQILGQMFKLHNHTIMLVSRKAS